MSGSDLFTGTMRLFVDERFTEIAGVLMSSDRIRLDQVLVARQVDEAERAAVAFLARYSGRT